MLPELAGPLADISAAIEPIGFAPDGASDRPTVDAAAIFRYFPNDRFSSRDFTPDHLRALLQRSPRVRWIQTHGVGVDGLRVPEVVERKITLTNGAAIHRVPMAESALALMLALAKRLPRHRDAQAQHAWKREQKDELRDATVLIVGYGRIGQEVGRLSQAFGMRTIGVKRRIESASFADEVITPDRLLATIGQADWVVLTASLNDTSRGIIGREALARMKPGAYLINLGRGQLVDEPALIAALRAKQIAGAALDVFWEEPLPPTSPLWEMDNVLISPHNSASSPRMHRRVLELFLDNTRRFVAGEPLLNVAET